MSNIEVVQNKVILISAESVDFSSSKRFKNLTIGWEMTVFAWDLGFSGFGGVVINLQPGASVIKITFVNYKLF